MDKKYKPSEFAELLNVSVKTLQRWDREGTLNAYRTPKNRRYYTHNQYLAYTGETPEDEKAGKVVLYARVSNRGQKDDLESQVNFLQQFANAQGVIVDEIIEDIGSGLNYNRKKWNKLLDDIQAHHVSKVYITHKDRFVRFGYDWFERFVEKMGTEIIVVKNEKLSPQEEMIQDLISIIHVFSCRIHGLRKYKNTIQKDREL
ncbi:IS607 family transposase [Domibacillus sp.]|uniref:IS607 family transposase n=1 Tax=Domibacillus sp. TaxID=1969783 RepID=UPI0028110211|nr:IS607 family transposase [Domibacillus sp.]